MKKWKLLIIILFTILMAPLLLTYIDYQLYSYRDFYLVDQNQKPKIFRKEVADDLITIVSKKDFKNDTLFYFEYKNKYKLVCWILEQYNDIPLSKIEERLSLSFKTEDWKTYFIYSGGKNFPIRVSTLLRLPTTKKISLIFNSCDSIREKIISQNYLLYNLKCNEIGLLTKENYGDLTLCRDDWSSFADFMIYKSKNKFYMLMLFSTTSSDVEPLTLLKLLNQP
ncbi:MAG: hypothetical protein PHF97_01600 [Bacteroidales bacterium]|nr:hypothetical protein [Bacteroidales bacterium]